MKSLLNIYMNNQNASLDNLLKKMHVDEPRLVELLTTWIDQGHLDKDNIHLTELKSRKAEKKQNELLEKYRDKLFYYQSLRDNGLSMIQTAQQMHMNPERMEHFFAKEIDRMLTEDLTDIEIAKTLRISLRHYQNIRRRAEERKAEKEAATARKLSHNQRYAMEFLKAIQNDINNGSSNILIFDMEGSQQPDEPIEISIIDIHGNVIFDSLIKPSRNIHWRITKLTGITNEMVEDAPDIHTVMPTIKKRTAGCTMLSWGTDYDSVLFANACETTGIQLDCTFGCAQKIHMGVINSPNQIALGTAAHITNQNHRALDDCKLVRKVLLHDLKILQNDKI